MNLNCPGEYSHSVVVLNVMIQEPTHQYALLMGQLISSYQVIIHCLNCLLYYIKHVVDETVRELEHQCVISCYLLVSGFLSMMKIC